MGKSRWFLPVLLQLLFLTNAAIAQQPLHWEATIDSAKVAASQSNRLVLILFSAPWCTACHHLENDIRNQPGAAAALEANFVPVKVNYDYFPNTAKQYGVTRLPTTVILVPNARGEVLAVIPEYIPADQYLAKINKVAADSKRRDAGVYAQIQASPPIGSSAGLGPATLPGLTASVTPNVAAPRSPATPSLNPVPPATLPAPGVANPDRAGIAAIAVSATPGSPQLAAVPAPGNRPQVPQKPSESTKPRVNPPLGLDGFCPVRLVENSRWEPGKKAWGAIHRGRTYLFVGAEERRHFMADPDRYAPVGSGDDVVLMLEQGKSVPGYREHGVQFEGHVYLFAGEGSLEKFRSNPHYYAERAMQAVRSAAQTTSFGR